MFIQFLNLLATIISVISLLIVTYGALIAFIAFTINELKRFTGNTPQSISGDYGLLSGLTYS